MNWLNERWREFWFAPTRPDNLGIARILFYALTLLLYVNHDFSRWESLAEVHWLPMWSFRVLGIPAFSEYSIRVMQIGWKLAMLLSCLGLFTRVSTWMAFLLGFYLLGLEQSFSRIVHTDGIVVLVQLTMALSRCGDSWSIDAWLKRHASSRPMSGEYMWPIKAVWLIMSLIYFASGFAKLRHSGLEWIFSENMATLFRTHSYIGSPWTTWGLWFAQHPWLCYAMAGAAVLVEISFPIAMFSRLLRWPILLTAFCMHLGILALMGPVFWQFQICYVFWVPWSRMTVAGNSIIH